MHRLHPILIVIGFRLRANAPEGQKRFSISFLTTFALSAGLVLFPAGAKAAYVATELAVLTEASTRVVREVNSSTEVVGGARLGSGRHQGFLLDGRVVPIGSVWGRDLPVNRGPFQTRALALPIEGFPGSDYSTAYGVNDFGDIAGAATTATGLRAFKSHRNTAYIAQLSRTVPLERHRTELVEPKRSSAKPRPLLVEDHRAPSDARTMTGIATAR